MTFRGLIAITAGIITASATQAAEWSIEPSISLSSRYDDNIRLSSTNEIDATEIAMKPSSAFSWQTERSTITGIADFTIRRFSEDGLDTNDSSFKFNASHGLSEMTHAGISATWIKDTTLDSELDETGILFDRTERKSLTISPRLDHRVNEKWIARFSASASDVKYQNEVRSDYKTLSSNGTLEWEYTPKTAIFGQLSFTRQEYDNDSYKSDNRQLTLGTSHEFSERLTLDAYFGARRTETTTLAGSYVCPEGYSEAGPNDYATAYGFPCQGSGLFDWATQQLVTFDRTLDSSGSVFSTTLNYKLEKGSISSTISRDVSPTASYGLVVSERLRINFLHKFSETLSSKLNITYSQTDGSDQTLAVIDEKFTSISPSLIWLIDRDLSLSANYRYRKQEREGALDSATSNAVSFALNYSWPKVAVSR